MDHWLTKPISPATVWFWLLQSLTGLCLAAYWIDVLGHFNQWLRFGDRFGMYATFTFAGSLILLFRFSRVLGILASIITWLLIAFMTHI